MRATTLPDVSIAVHVNGQSLSKHPDPICRMKKGGTLLSSSPGNTTVSTYIEDRAGQLFEVHVSSRLGEGLPKHDSELWLDDELVTKCHLTIFNHMQAARTWAERGGTYGKEYRDLRFARHCTPGMFCPPRLSKGLT